MRVARLCEKRHCPRKTTIPLQKVQLLFRGRRPANQQENPGLKALCVLLYAVGNASFNMLAYLFQSWPSLIYRWIVEAKLKMPEPKITKKTIGIESDEMWHFRQKKKNKKWIIKALDRCTGKTIAWVIVVSLNYLQKIEGADGMRHCISY